MLVYRRRMLCFLDEVFSLTVGRKPGDIDRLSAKACTELALCCILAPAAVIDLRLQPACSVSVVDASSSLIAACTAPVTRAVGEELFRHTVRRGRWTRLLSPLARWQRQNSMLEPD